MFLSILSSIAVLFLVTFLTLLVIIYFYSTWHFDYWKNLSVPYEKPLPILGNLTFILHKSCLQYFYEVYQRHSDDKLVGLFLGRRPVLLVQDAELVKNILQNDFDAFQDRSLYTGCADPLGSLNIFTLNNPTWSEMRRRLTPMFTPARLRVLHETMDATSIKLVERIQRCHVDGNEEVDLKMLFSLFTTDVIGTTVFGLRGEALEKTDSALWTITSHMVKFKWPRALEFICIFLVPGLAEKLRFQFFSKVATEYIREIFWSVARNRLETNTVGQTKDLLDNLLRIRESANTEGFEMSDDLIIAQAAVFILGGIETSSATLSFTLHELAFHPEEQERLYEEIRETDERVQGKLDYETLSGMTYLKMVLHETMRKYPSLMFLDRMCARDYQLGDLSLPKGLPVFINVTALHYDEKIFPEPMRWDPEHFAVEPQPFQFLPFGEGPRYCIGKRYGLLQVCTALVHIIRRYRLRPTPGTPAPSLYRTDPNGLFSSPGRVSVVFELRDKVQ